MNRAGACPLLEHRCVYGIPNGPFISRTPLPHRTRELSPRVDDAADQSKENLLHRITYQSNVLTRTPAEVVVVVVPFVLSRPTPEQRPFPHAHKCFFRLASWLIYKAQSGKMETCMIVGKISGILENVLVWSLTYMSYNKKKKKTRWRRVDGRRSAHQRSLYDETFAIDESPTTFLIILVTRNGIEC
jgi:hypothetical protein